MADKQLVRMVPPPNTGTVVDREGNSHLIEEDGTVQVPVDLAPTLNARGYKYASEHQTISDLQSRVDAIEGGAKPTASKP